MALLEPVAGILLMMLGVIDLFLTVLYARIGTQRGSRVGMGLGRWVARAQWTLARSVGALGPRWRVASLSASAPLTLVWMVALWALLLTLGAALVFHPALGGGLRRPTGATPTDFTTALFVAGSSLSVVSSSDISPQTSAYRIAFLVNAFVGASALTLTLTYFMQIYRALQTRNALGLKLATMSRGGRNGADLLACWGPGGRFDACYSTLVEVAGELAEVHEAHHLYPLLFYFRFETAYPNLTLFLPTLLEAAGLLTCALAEGEQAWVARSGAAWQMRHGGLALLDLLDRTFLPGRFGQNIPPPAAQALSERFERSIAVLRSAGVAAVDDLAAREAYLAFMDTWIARARRLAAYLGHEPDDILRAPGAAGAFGHRKSEDVIGAAAA